MMMMSVLAALCVSAAALQMPPAVRPLGRGRIATARPSSEVSEADALLEQAAALRAEADALGAVPVVEQTPEEAAATATEQVMANRKKISEALKAATKTRDKEQLRIALSAAEQGGFSGKDEDVQKAVVAFNELSELSDTMRQRLIKEAASQGADPTAGWNPGNQYLGIFALMTVLVLTAGKDIFF